MTDPRYALDIAGRVGNYAVIDDFPRALHAAYDELVLGATSVTVLRIEGADDALAFTALATITPPVIPTFSTSPEVSA